MRSALVRGGLVALAFVSAVVGVWALFAPRSFYDDFPGAGGGWVSGDGPFNEHLTRDVGAYNLALAVLLTYAAVSLARPLVVAALLTDLTVAVPHFVYHAAHLDTLATTADRIAQTSILAIGIVLPAALLVVATRQRSQGDSRLT